MDESHHIYPHPKGEAAEWVKAHTLTLSRRARQQNYSSYSQTWMVINWMDLDANRKL